MNEGHAGDGREEECGHVTRGVLEREAWILMGQEPELEVW